MNGTASLATTRRPLDTTPARITSRHCLYKTALIKPRRSRTGLTRVEIATAEWIDWYNHSRLHGEIGHIPPAECEANYYLATTKHQFTTAN
ncbi:integrase core domain-containing protein [Streptomyces scopuliridis]|uniref:integrase core domain-containing protein n=1 Tax=Streptomyces scopuliridis TaxID=452529 RepID=UPI0036B53285